VELAAGDGDYYFAPHDLALHVGVGVYFACVVAVAGDRFVGGKFFQPYVKVVVKAGLIVIDKNAGGNVHGVGKAQAFLNAGIPQKGLNFARYIDKFARFFGVEP